MGILITCQTLNLGYYSMDLMIFFKFIKKFKINQFFVLQYDEEKRERL
jgi:hypothetical protein